MTIKEAERLRLFKNHANGEISLIQISKLLGISYRQTKRIWQKFKDCGAEALVSKKRATRNRALSIELEKTILSLISEHYSDYGPTLLAEKLEEFHQIRVSKETVRKLMIRHGLRKSKARKKPKVYQRRKRRDCLGELEQVDGSPHAWFEDRGPYCTLLLTIDDATGKIMAARFEEEETTVGYFRLMKDYLSRHGKPVYLYSDKHGVFRVNQGEDRSKLTQFACAMSTLGIRMIFANSPQAKGRIERANRVLQDRLVKELRRLGISTIEDGNAFLPTYIEDYNKHFGKVPVCPFNAHCSLDHKQDLECILSKKTDRKISKNLEVQYKNTVYQIQAPDRVNRLRGACVQMIEKIDGEILMEYKGELLNYIVYKEFAEQLKTLDCKQLATEGENSGSRQQVS